MAAEADAAGSRMTDAHRFFVQGMVLQPLLSQAEAEALRSRAFEAFPQDRAGGTNLEAFVRHVNGALAQVQMRIAPVTEGNGERLFALVRMARARAMLPHTEKPFAARSTSWATNWRSWRPSTMASRRTLSRNAYALIKASLRHLMCAHRRLS